MAEMVIPYFMCAHDPFTGKVSVKETINAEIAHHGLHIASSSVRKGVYRAKVRIDGKVQTLIARVSEQKTSWQANGDLVVEFDEGSAIRL